MKVLHIITQSEFGGAQRHVRDLVRWQRSKHDVEVACGGGGPLIRIVQELGAPTHVLHNLVRPIRPAQDLAAIRTITSLARSGRYDVVHCHSTKAGLLGRSAARLAGVKRIIFTAHGFAFNEPGPLIKRKMYETVELIGSALCDKIIAVSRFDFASGIRAGIRSDRMAVIHNGVFPEDLPQPANSRSFHQLGVPEGAQCILAIGYFYRNKGFLSLIQAAAGLPREVHILIIGDGPEIDSAKALRSRLGLDDRVHLPGALTHANRFLAHADIVAIPSLKEGLPYQLLEAMAVARPVVATRVGGIPEAVEHGHSGLLVAAGDPGELRDALLRLVEDRNYATRLGAEGRATIARAFQGQLMCQRTDGLYGGFDS